MERVLDRTVSMSGGNLSCMDGPLVQNSFPMETISVSSSEFPCNNNFGSTKSGSTFTPGTREILPLIQPPPARIWGLISQESVMRSLKASLVGEIRKEEEGLRSNHFISLENRRKSSKVDISRGELRLEELKRQLLTIEKYEQTPLTLDQIIKASQVEKGKYHDREASLSRDLRVRSHQMEGLGPSISFDHICDGANGVAAEEVDKENLCTFIMPLGSRLCSSRDSSVAPSRSSVDCGVSQERAGRTNSINERCNNVGVSIQPHDKSPFIAPSTTSPPLYHPCRIRSMVVGTARHDITSGPDLLLGPPNTDPIQSRMLCKMRNMGILGTGEISRLRSDCPFAYSDEEEEDDDDTRDYNFDEIILEVGEKDERNRFGHYVYYDNSIRRSTSFYSNAVNANNNAPIFPRPLISTSSKSNSTSLYKPPDQVLRERTIQNLMMINSNSSKECLTKYNNRKNATHHYDDDIHKKPISTSDRKDEHEDEASNPNPVQWARSHRDLLKFRQQLLNSVVVDRASTILSNKSPLSEAMEAHRLFVSQGSCVVNAPPNTHQIKEKANKGTVSSPMPSPRDRWR